MTWRIRKRLYKNTNKRFLVIFRSAAILASVLGAIWIVGAILVAADFHKILQAIFASIVPLQGAFIFICHGLGNKDIRAAWKRGLKSIVGLFTCCKRKKAMIKPYSSLGGIQYSDVSFRRRAWTMPSTDEMELSLVSDRAQGEAIPAQFVVHV